MNTNLLFKTISRRFYRYKLKSSIMMLGIIISVCALTVSLTTGVEMKRLILEFFNKTFLPNSITLESSQTALQRGQLSLKDIDSVINTVSGISSWTPVIVAGNRDLVKTGRSNTAALMGIGVDARDIIRPVIEGEYISDEDVRGRRKTVLIGKTVAEKLFPGESPLGEQLEIDRLIFTIKGILKPLGFDPHGGDLDNIIAIPYTTMMQMNKTDYLSNVRFMAENNANLSQITDGIAAVIRQRHNIGPGEPDGFYVSTAPMGKRMFNEMESTFKLLVPVISATTYLISAVVITIIMLISLKERTMEIGLRKALGARPADLHLQFILEVLFIVCLGAVIGLLTAIAGLQVLESVFLQNLGTDITLSPQTWVILLSIFCSILAGMVSGYYPAARAAKLVPVEALR